MTWLLLDAGNTALKWALAAPAAPHALARGSVKLGPGFAEGLTRAVAEALSSLGPDPSRGLVAIGCSVASEAATGAVTEAIRPVVAGGVRWLASQARFDDSGVTLVNGYREAAQLGADRWHAMIAARHSFPDRAAVVVCAGTATTVDSIDAAGRFLGGVIAPGSALMSDSLARGTARLPQSAGRAVAMPDNTNDAIATGVADAQAGLVERRVRALARAGARPQLVLAGGGAAELAGRLSLGADVGGVLVEEPLVLRGLWLRASAGAAA